MFWPQHILVFVVIGCRLQDIAYSKQCTGESDHLDSNTLECEYENCQRLDEWSDLCELPRLMVNMDKHLVTMILKELNTYRDIVARGQLDNMPPAARMLKLRWDPYLAKQARTVALRCSLEPYTKDCRTQANGPGYNAALSKYPANEKQEIEQIIKAHLRAWFHQGQFASSESLTTCESTQNEDISQFLQLVSGLNSRVGCAVAVFKRGYKIHQTTTCFFGCHMQHYQKIYEHSAKAGSACRCGMDANFTSLCDIQDREQDNCTFF